jgi:DNA-binding transcriptional ArsR family regulator
MTPKTIKRIDNLSSSVRTIHLERIEKAFLDSVPEKDLMQLTHVYKALGDPTRLKISLALIGGEMCVCDLAAYLELSESAISHQLRRLKDLNLVKNRRKGQVLYYSLDDEHVLDFLLIGLDHIRE